MAKFVSTPSQNFDVAVINKPVRKFAPGIGLLAMGAVSTAVWIGIASLIMGFLGH